LNIIFDFIDTDKAMDTEKKSRWGRHIRSPRSVQSGGLGLQRAQKWERRLVRYICTLARRPTSFLPTMYYVEHNLDYLFEIYDCDCNQSSNDAAHTTALL